jgi:hypothetical protein
MAGRVMASPVMAGRAMALGTPESALQAALGSGRYGDGPRAVNRPVACSRAFLGPWWPRPGHDGLGRAMMA